MRLCLKHRLEHEILIETQTYFCYLCELEEKLAAAIIERDEAIARVEGLEEVLDSLRGI